MDKQKAKEDLEETESSKRFCLEVLAEESPSGQGENLEARFAYIRFFWQLHGFNSAVSTQIPACFIAANAMQVDDASVLREEHSRSASSANPASTSSSSKPLEVLIDNASVYSRILTEPATGSDTIDTSWGGNNFEDDELDETDEALLMAAPKKTARQKSKRRFWKKSQKGRATCSILSKVGMGPTP